MRVEDRVELPPAQLELLEHRRGIARIDHDGTRGITDRPDVIVREGGDAGTPLDEKSPSTQAIRDIADQIIKRSSSLAGRRLPLSTI